MKKFVFGMYACDAVPIEHLQVKLRYLFDVPSEVVIIFVKNLFPQEVLVGKGAFRKVQCQYIKRIKIKIRNRYNPRHPDKTFRIPPLERGVTHEHVIHTSDYEEQVDYVLKLLGHSEGIRLLESNDSDLPFCKPYHLPRPKKYTMRNIALEDVRASIRSRKNTQEIRRLPTKIQDTPHYLALCNGEDVYKDYVQNNRYKYPKDDHNWEKLSRMSKYDEMQISAFDPILVARSKGYYLILDGVHRAAVAKYRGLKQVKCVVFEK